ncbi:hypothetical protein AK830_g5175 [Neonectria ditissima]|uniref:Uncharacterized protein n=1 Tax=Neonectria ditissima TaxID=78410 RepID=A0A0P7B4V7_9HYPO|nr:hypothetical protein AK830_g5175 [Neonectria ditissima]
MTTPFTFVNTSNAPRLGSSEAKQMRAHVTKTNFAQRRRRLAVERQQKGATETRPDGDESTQRRVARRSAPPSPSLDLQLCSRAGDPHTSIRFLLTEFRPLVFPAGNGLPGSVNEALWVRLVLSEPALMDASMAVGMRHWPGKTRGAASVCADVHMLRAVSAINRRLDAAAAGLTDGILAAVFTLALSERLINNETAWNIHVNGLSQMVKLRQSNGNNALPPWFSNFLIHDSINEMIAIPAAPLGKFIDALRSPGAPSGEIIFHISCSMKQLREELNHYYAHPAAVESLSQQIGCRVSDLSSVLEPFLDAEGPSIRAWAVAIQSFLYLSWPPSSEGVCLHGMARKLRHALGEPEIRLCASIEMTVWEYFIGAIAADEGSEAREWYVVRLRRMFVSMKVCEWKTVLQRLEKAIMPDVRLLESFKGTWDML